jgi:hypothetical protein
MIGIYLFVIGVTILFAVRIETAGAYHEHVLNKMHNKIMAAYGKGFDYQTYVMDHEYWDMYHNVDCVKMYFMFWRKYSSFYPREFLDEIGVK